MKVIRRLVLAALLVIASAGLTGCAGLGGGGQGQGLLGGLGAGPAGGGLTGSLAGGLPSAPGATGVAATKVPPGENQTQRNWCQAYLDRVNELRARIGVGPASFDERLFQGCLARTPQLAQGMDDHAGFGNTNDGATGECLAGSTDPKESADMYFSEGPGGGHYELMFPARITRIAGATGLGASVSHSR